ncbi:hypothetical protein KP509_08G039200 [Ceratopteris richardii]|uniref:shikimate kinase n=1 Tax=Ceratopteris richardii TaxID=49495 RepID=A0A8T2UBG4_CERRI|nr:hypothetical protein KP509_08G039200 [Ceratopteris richardii]
MDVMQSRNVHIPRAGSEHLHSIRRHQQCLASGSLSIFRTTGVSCSLRHSLQGRRLLLSEDTSFPTLEIRSCAHGHRPPSAHNTGFPATSVNKFKCAVDDDQNLLLKERGRVIAPHLKGRCIYLVGMMGSGKTTVGKLIADALGYQFTDSDKVIEDDNGLSVAEFFRLQNEMSFRDAETRVLEKLSHNLQQVISTGGGIVVRPENWKYMRYGLTVWLDVPLEALAERVVAVGTHSRPLLGGELDSESAYSKVNRFCLKSLVGHAFCLKDLMTVHRHVMKFHLRICHR